jgi:hypothetical protein
VDSFDRRIFLSRNVHRENQNFKQWFAQLKRVYPWPEWSLAELIDVDVTQVWRWRNGQGRPARRVIRFMACLIAWRIGAVETGRDLLRVRKWVATGELESMVDDFLEREAALEAQADARKARKCAKTRRQTLPWFQKS